MTAPEFIATWRQVGLSERSASQQHFLDLCALVGHGTPASIDPIGESFTFERGAAKLGGGDGWADVWKRGCFGWEYKGKHKDLDAAYAHYTSRAKRSSPRMAGVWTSLTTSCSRSSWG
jgi:hypothetical protein